MKNHFTPLSKQRAKLRKEWEKLKVKPNWPQYLAEKEVEHQNATK